MKCTMFTKLLKVRMSDMQEWTEEVLEPDKTLFLCFSLYMFKFDDRVRKQSFTIVEFEFFDIFYSKFQLESTFSICSKFCVENWLRCDMICKWVTCRSGCKRFWKSALHICVCYCYLLYCYLVVHLYNVDTGYTFSQFAYRHTLFQGTHIGELSAHLHTYLHVGR